MYKNHGAWLAVAVGVAIAGTSYAASAVLFKGSNVKPAAPVEAVAIAEPTVSVKSPSSASEVIPSPAAAQAPQPSNQAAAPKASEPTRVLTPVYAEQRHNPALAQAILRELPGYPCADVAPTDEEAIRYFYTFEDLNRDGREEAIAYLVGAYTCGTGGCTALIFDVNGGEYTLNSRISLVHAPIIVANTQTNGWQDLVIPVSGGGATPSDRVVSWTGQSYTANPSIAPVWTGASLEGKALFAATVTADTPAPTLTGDVCLP